MLRQSILAMTLSLTFGFASTASAQSDSTASSPTTAKMESGSENLVELTPASKPEWSIVMPFELLKSGHMAIQVKLNGKGPFRVVFDTGAPSVMFSGNAGKACGVLKADAKSFMLGRYAESKIDSVQCGDFVLHAVHAEIQDHPTVMQLGEKLGGLEGLVGFPLLNPARLTIDYQAGTITFVPRMDGRKERDSERKKAMAEAIGKGDRNGITLSPDSQFGLVIKKEGDELAGVVVKKVFANSAAAESGLQVGDRVLMINNRWTDSGADFFRAASKVSAGSEAVLSIQRGSETISLKIKPRSGL